MKRHLMLPIRMIYVLEAAIHQRIKTKHKNISRKSDNDKKLWQPNKKFIAHKQLREFSSLARSPDDWLWYSVVYKQR